MSTMKTDLERITLLLERMRDAELLPDAEGVRLLTQTEAARQALEEGDTQAAQRHIEQVAHYLEALVAANTLALSDGRAVIQAANDFLIPKAGAGEAPR